MNTPVKQKRVRTEAPGTPIPPRKQKNNAAISVYTPTVAKLRVNYDVEFGKFLKAIKHALEYIEGVKRNKLAPMRRTIRRMHKELNGLHLYFKALGYWKSFYTNFIEHNDQVMACFRLEDTRDIDTVIASHAVPAVLVSFVTQQLMDWRELFADVPWLNEYRTLQKQLVDEERHRQEASRRIELLKEIALEIEMCGLKISDFKRQAPEKLVKTVGDRVCAAKAAQERAEHLKLMPTLSKRSNTKEWCRKHLDQWKKPPMTESFLSTSSDEDSSTSEGNSSLFANKDDSDSSSDGIDSFFQDFGH